MITGVFLGHLAACFSTKVAAADTFGLVGVCTTAICSRFVPNPSHWSVPLPKEKINQLPIPSFNPRTNTQNQANCWRTRVSVESQASFQKLICRGQSSVLSSKQAIATRSKPDCAAHLLHYPRRGWSPLRRGVLRYTEWCDH